MKQIFLACIYLSCYSVKFVSVPLLASTCAAVKYTTQCSRMHNAAEDSIPTKSAISPNEPVFLYEFLFMVIHKNCLLTLQFFINVKLYKMARTDILKR